MGIQFFDEPIVSSGDISFVKEYLLEHPQENGKEFSVQEVKLVQSQKGYLVRTDNFLCFLWKRSSTAILLVEALEVYVRETYGYTVVVVLDDSTREKFRLGINPELPCMWYGSGKKFTTTLDIPTFQVDQVNPFLIPHAPSTPISRVHDQNGKTKGLSQQKHGKAT